MTLTVGMTTQLPNPQTGVLETFKLVYLHEDQYGALTARWEKVG
jgi:hypothetical protein